VATPIVGRITTLQKKSRPLFKGLFFRRQLFFDGFGVFLTLPGAIKTI
jgi:hypothetical protein